MERDDLYKKFVKAIHEVQQKSNFKNFLLEKKLGALADTLEKKEAQLNEVLSASNLDPTALTVVTRKLEVCYQSISMIDHYIYLVLSFFFNPRTHKNTTILQNLLKSCTKKCSFA